MAVEQNTIVDRVEVEDATGPGAASAVSNIQKIAAGSDRMGAAVKSSSNAFAAFDKAAGSAATQLNRLRGQADPTVAAVQRLERAERDLDRAMKQGLTTEAEKLRILDQLAVKYGATAAANQNLAGAQANVARSGVRMGTAIQQAGYQVGDFAVQVASGQSPMRAFIQQGTQLVSMFGPWGAVIGAAGAVVGALGMAFLGQEEAADKASDATTTYGESVKAAAELVDSINQSLETREEGYRRVAAAALEGAELEVQAAQAKIEANIRVAETGGQMRRAAQGRVNDARADLAEAQADLDRLQAEIDAAIAAANFDALKTRAEAIVDGLLPATAATRKYQEQQETLNAAVRAGAITEGDYTAAMVAAADQRDAVLSRFVDILNSFQAERELMALSNAERAVQVELDKQLNKLKEAGYALTEVGIARLEDEIRLTQQLRRDRAGRDFLADLDRENNLLRLRLAHGADEVEILEAQAKLRDKLGRDLIPGEAAAIRNAVEAQQRLTEEIERTEDAEKKFAEAFVEIPDALATEFTELVEEALT